MTDIKCHRNTVLRNQRKVCIFALNMLVLDAFDRATRHATLSVASTALSTGPPRRLSCHGSAATRCDDEEALAAVQRRLAEFRSSLARIVVATVPPSSSANDACSGAVLEGHPEERSSPQRSPLLSYCSRLPSTAGDADIGAFAASLVASAAGRCFTSNIFSSPPPQGEEETASQMLLRGESFTATPPAAATVTGRHPFYGVTTPSTLSSLSTQAAADGSSSGGLVMFPAAAIAPRGSAWGVNATTAVTTEGNPTRGTMGSATGSPPISRQLSLISTTATMDPGGGGDTEVLSKSGMAAAKRRERHRPSSIVLTSSATGDASQRAEMGMSSSTNTTTTTTTTTTAPGTAASANNEAMSSPTFHSRSGHLLDSSTSSGPVVPPREQRPTSKLSTSLLYDGRSSQVLPRATMSTAEEKEGPSLPPQPPHATSTPPREAREESERLPLVGGRGALVGGNAADVAPSLDGQRDTTTTTTSGRGGPMGAEGSSAEPLAQFVSLRGGEEGSGSDDGGHKSAPPGVGGLNRLPRQRLSSVTGGSAIMRVASSNGSFDAMPSASTILSFGESPSNGYDSLPQNALLAQRSDLGEEGGGEGGGGGVAAAHSHRRQQCIDEDDHHRSAACSDVDPLTRSPRPHQAALNAFVPTA